MSLSDAQEIFDLLTQIDQLLTEIESKTQNVEANVPQVNEATTSFRQFERITVRYLVLTERLGLPKDITAAIRKLAQLLSMIRMVQMSMSLLEASNPVTMVFGITGLFLTAATAPSLLEGW